MDHFVDKSRTSGIVEKLPHNSARAKKLTEEFIVRDLRPVSTVDGNRFLIKPNGGKICCSMLA